MKFGIMMGILFCLLLGIAMGTIADERNCGRPLSMNSRIYGGNETCLGCIPWQVELQVNDPYWRHKCGGTIVSSRYVVTAAHCAYKLVGMEQALKVIAGMVDYYDEDATVHEVKKIHVHPKWAGPPTYDYDYAILELEDLIDIEGESKSRAACLPEKDDTEFDENTVFRISGWGQGSERRNLLMDIFVPWMSSEDCQPIATTDQTPITPRMICAGHGPEEVYDRVCKGDSGGGLMWRDSQTGQAKLIGMTSFGYVTGFIPPLVCNEGHPAVYSKVTTVLDWIKNITGL